MFGPFNVHKRRFALIAHATLCLSLLLGLVPAQVYAATDACPASPAGLPDVRERDDFCVYYDDANTTQGEADTVADHTQDYWDRYTSADFGFREPQHTDKLVVDIINSADCNGGTSPSTNEVTINNGCFDASAESVQQTAGHELFHRVQYSYHGTEVKWFKEGTARAMEDLAFTNIDHWANALMAPFSFNLQANEYLGNSNVDITSIPQRYNSALWWKYFTEQFGSASAEPFRGVNAFLRLWEAAETLDDIAALNSALSTLGAGTTFDGAFRRFTAANYIKDLTNQPGPQYNYIDEDEVGTPGVYGPVNPTNGGNINVGTAASFPNQAISRYGARYYRAQPAAPATCPVISALFHTDSGPAFYHVITQKTNALDNFATSTATDYQRSFFNDGDITRIVAIAGSTDNSAQVDVTLECVNPVINIVMPNDPAVAHVGPSDGPGKFLAQVQVHNGSVAGPVVAGLTVNDFKAKVNNTNALITSGAFIQEQYWLLIQAPNLGPGNNGIYDLEITLEQADTSTAIATATNADSVSYDPDNIDHLLVIDRSGSMSTDNKMVDARNAAKFYVDITRLNDGLAVIPYNEDVNPAPFTLRAVTAVPNVRQDAKNYIDTIDASGLTSIGDGMGEAAAERTATPTGNPGCAYVLLSDGMENSAQFWADVDDTVIGTGCPVTSIAFGPAADETLMQNIATATGGLYYYNDVFTSGSANVAGVDGIDAASDTALALGNIYEYAQGKSEKRQRVSTDKNIIKYSPSSPPASTMQTQTVMIDDSMTEALFALDWIRGRVPLSMSLQSPNGDLISPLDRPYDFFDANAGHLGWRISGADLIPGTWTVLIDFPRVQNPGAQIAAVDEPDQSGDLPYQLIVSGPSDLTLDLLLPYRAGAFFTTGQRMPIFAILDKQGPIGGIPMSATVTSPSGVLNFVSLFDDGAHGDGEAGDGFYGGLYKVVNEATKVDPVEAGAPATPGIDEGSYQVKLDVQGSDFQRESLASFSVEEGDNADGDSMPDVYGVTGDGGDPDLDGLDNLSEYQVGTDPNDSDTDGGGENDASENDYGRDPFNPTNDLIDKPEFLVAEPNDGLNVITYDVKANYDRLVLYRSTMPTVTWDLAVPELPTSGVYSDTEVSNGTLYYYRYMAIDDNAEGTTESRRTTVIGATPVIPAADPFQPEASVLIDEGAPSTPDLNVELSFVPYGHEIEYFSDIEQMKISNDPLLTGADWISYTPGVTVSWVLSDTADDQLAKVYAQFKDGADNESLIVMGAIIYDVDQAPVLTLVKNVVNDDGGTATASNWTLSATGPATLSGPGPSVTSGPSFVVGTYALAESGGPAGYAASAWVCTGTGQQNGASITLALGQHATCTITNDDVDAGELNPELWLPKLERQAP